MNTIQAAQALGMTPRARRRHRGLNPSLAGRGEGRQYIFTDEDIASIKATMKPSRVEDPPELEWLNQTPGFTLSQASDPRYRRQVLEQRRERANRLNLRLAQLAKEADNVVSS